MFRYKATYTSGKAIVFRTNTDKAARKHGKKFGKITLLERQNGAGGWVPIIKNGRRIRYNEFITPADDMRKVLLWGSVVITPFVILITRLLDLI